MAKRKGSKKSAKTARRTTAKGTSRKTARKKPDKVARRAKPSTRKKLTKRAAGRPTRGNEEVVFAPTAVGEVAAAAEETIGVGDSVRALVALLSTSPPPPVVVPPGTIGTVASVSPTGRTTGYLVDFVVNAQVRRAPAFTGQIARV